MAMIPMTTFKITPAPLPKLAKALGMLREPRAMASTMRQIWTGWVEG